MSARLTLRISSSDFPENMEPTTTSSQDASRCGMISPLSIMAEKTTKLFSLMPGKSCRWLLLERLQEALQPGIHFRFDRNALIRELFAQNRGVGPEDAGLAKLAEGKKYSLRSTAGQKLIDRGREPIQVVPGFGGNRLVRWAHLQGWSTKSTLLYTAMMGCAAPISFKTSSTASFCSLDWGWLASITWSRRSA